MRRYIIIMSLLPACSSSDNPINRDAGSVDAAPSACDRLFTQEDCEATAGCASIFGAPAEQVCMDDRSSWASVWAGCTDAGRGCDDVETCASNPVLGTRMYFPDSCVPFGWIPCDCTVPQTCENGGDPVPAGQVCVRGDVGVTGEILRSDTPIRIQVTPMGCYGSGCVYTYHNVCEASLNGTDIALDSLVCLGPSGAVDCLPDCGGAGQAVCHTPALADGTYTITVDGLSLSFTIPSEIPFGGQCEGSPF